MKRLRCFRERIISSSSDSGALKVSCCWLSLPCRCPLVYVHHLIRRHNQLTSTPRHRHVQCCNLFFDFSHSSSCISTHLSVSFFCHRHVRPLFLFMAYFFRSRLPRLYSTLARFESRMVKHTIELKNLILLRIYYK